MVYDEGDAMYGWMQSVGVGGGGQHMTSGRWEGVRSEGGRSGSA